MRVDFKYVLHINEEHKRKKNYILICNTKYTYYYMSIYVYDWISICADREIIMNATRVGGSTTRAGKMGGNLRGDNIKDNNETETNFNRSGVRKTLTTEERILLLKSGIDAYNYYNGDYWSSSLTQEKCVLWCTGI